MSEFKVKIEFPGIDFSSDVVLQALRREFKDDATISVVKVDVGYEIRIVTKDAPQSATSIHDEPILHGRNDNKKVVVSEINKYGKVLLARKEIFQGEIIAVFDGEIITVPRSASQLLPNYAPIFFRAHAIMIDKHTWQDSNGIARYASHSCDPNCGINNLREIVAMRYINPGEQITWDYSMTEDPEADDFKMVCLCNAQNCRGLIRGYRHLPQEFRDKYKGFISEWLEPGYVIEK